MTNDKLRVVARCQESSAQSELFVICHLSSGRDLIPSVRTTITAIGTGARYVAEFGAWVAHDYADETGERRGYERGARLRSCF